MSPTSFCTIPYAIKHDDKMGMRGTNVSRYSNGVLRVQSVTWSQMGVIQRVGRNTHCSVHFYPSHAHISRRQYKLVPSVCLSVHQWALSRSEGKVQEGASTLRHFHFALHWKNDRQRPQNIFCTTYVSLPLQCFQQELFSSEFKSDID